VTNPPGALHQVGLTRTLLAGTTAPLVCGGPIDAI